MRRRYLTAAIVAVALVAVALALAVGYRANAQGTPAVSPPLSPPAPLGPKVIERLNGRGTPVPFLANPATFPHLNDPLPPASQMGAVICGHHLSAHWEGRVLVVDGPDGTPVTTPCGTPGATPRATPNTNP